VVADRLVAAGITSILNFAPAVVTVPPGVDLRKVDLSIELQILAFHEQRKTANHASPATRRARRVRRLREDPVNPGEYEDTGAAASYTEKAAVSKAAPASTSVPVSAAAPVSTSAPVATPALPYTEEQFVETGQFADPVADTEPIPRYGYDEVRPA
jgi:redox-sensing transcriptional repressor